MFERKLTEQDLLREVGIDRISYRGTLVYESSGSLPEGGVTVAIYYEVHGDDVSTIIKHWGDISCNRTAIDLLISSIRLEEDLHLPYVHRGRHRFVNALKSETFSFQQDIAEALSASRPKWTLALWDADKQMICLIRYRN